MSRRELATAAADLLIINRPSARDLGLVEQRFHLHPLDLDALFSVPQKSSSQSYAGYFRLTVTWPELSGGHVQLADAVFYIQDDALAVVSHHQSPVLSAVMGVWLSQGKTDQRSPLELLVDSLAIIARSIESAVTTTAVDQNLLTSLTSALQDVPAAMAALDIQLRPELQQRLAMIQHRLKYAGETLVTGKRALQPTQAPTRRLGHVVRGYALASASLIVLVIVAVTR